MFVNVEIAGIDPGILFCNPRACNMFDPATRVLNKFKAAYTENKTEENLEMYLKAQWNCSQYWKPDFGCYIPRRMQQASLISAAKKEKQPGKKSNYKEIVASAMAPISDAVLNLPIDHKTEKDLAAMQQKADYFFVIPAAIGTKMVPIARPQFKDWSATLKFEIFDQQAVSIALATRFFGYMGKAGFGDWRPSSPTPGEFGTFDIVEITTSTDGKKWHKV
jgi:hypothetical protein